MKKINLIILLLLGTSSLFAKISFGSSDLNQNDELLFTVSQNQAGSKKYSSLFYTKLTNGETSANPEILTCYPEQMELLNNGTVLQIRNRYGIAKYYMDSGKFDWIYKESDIFKTSLPISKYSVSPDGKWICKIEKKTITSGKLILQNTQTEKTKILCDSVLQTNDELPVKWAPNSSFFVYEKEGNIYFCNPEALLTNVEVDEDFRKIGRGSINSVNWADEKTLIYIDDYVVYKISSKELYLTGLYSSIIGKGKAISRLPFQFNSKIDKFSVNKKADSFVFVQNSRLFSYLKIQKPTYDYMNVVYSKPYDDSSASLIDFFVFWDENENPILWLKKLPYDDVKEKGSVFKLGEKTVQVLEVEDSGCPIISPDETNVAFFSGNSIYVYNLTTWQRIAELTGEKISSALWLNSNVLYVGGDSSIMRWTLSTNSYESIMLSSVEKGFWSKKDNSIMAITKNGYSFRFYKSTGTWKKEGTVQEVKTNNKNEKYRVFLGKTSNEKFENALYVRNLSDKVTTNPLYKNSVEKNLPLKKVSLIFDAYDNADGLSKIISTLKKYNLNATFFLNGEFIRRYPLETKQIVVNGYEVSNMFFSNIDFCNNSFIVDEDFVRRGLARNEDEFFKCTGAELSLFWHAPFFSCDENVIKYGNKSGYTYVNSLHKNCDSQKLSRDYKPEDLIYEYCNNLKYLDNTVIPISVGFSQGERFDPLYNYLDILICALIDNNFEIVTVSELN